MASPMSMWNFKSLSLGATSRQPHKLMLRGGDKSFRIPGPHSARVSSFSVGINMLTQGLKTFRSEMFETHSETSIEMQLSLEETHWRKKNIFIFIWGGVTLRTAHLSV